MLTLMREHAQSWIIKVILGVIILTFIISFGVGQFSATKEVLVKVGSVEILVRDYNKRYQEELEKLRQQFPDNAEQFAQQFGLRKQVYQQMIDRTLLLQAADRKGLVVSDQEVSEAVHSVEIFKINGAFDFETYKRVLSQNRLTPESYESAVREDLLVGKYRRNLLAGLVVSRDEVEQRYLVENEQVQVDYFRVDPAKFRNQVKSDPEAEKAYYEKNKGRFMDPPRYKVKYFVLPLAKVKDAGKVRERAVTRYYERNRESEFSTEKQVRARHILKKIGQDASAEEKTKARTLLEELANRVKKGEDFAQLAKKHSDDTSKSKGGDLGFFTHGEMLPTFSEAAFALGKNQVSTVVETAFGLHLIQVTDIKPGRVRPFEEVKTEITNKLVDQRAERSLEVEAGRGAQQISTEGLEAIAKKFGVEVKESDWVDGNGRIEGLGASQLLYNQLRGMKKDNAGVLRRNPVQGHVFFQVAEAREASQKSMDQVLSQVRASVIEEKAAQAAVEASKSGIKEITSHQAFQAFQAKHGGPVKTASFSAVDRMIPELGANKDFQKAAFRASTENPFAASLENNQAHILYLKKRELTDAKEADQKKETIALQLESQWQSYFFEMELARLKTEIPVEVIAPEYVASL